VQRGGISSFGLPFDRELSTDSEVKKESRACPPFGRSNRPRRSFSIRGNTMKSSDGIVIGLGNPEGSRKLAGASPRSPRITRPPSSVGATENSPTIHRWVKVPVSIFSPSSTQERRGPGRRRPVIFGAQPFPAPADRSDEGRCSQRALLPHFCPPGNQQARGQQKRRDGDPCIEAR